MSEPLVSVLLPSYNHANYIEEAIISIANQTYKNIELIIIDDGSTDGSDEIIKKLQEKHTFNYEHQINCGLIKTLDKLIKKANGKYISLFSSDDLYTLNKIEKLVNFLEQNTNYAMVYSKIALIDAHSHVYKTVEEPYKAGKIFEDLLSGNFFINGLGVLIKKEIYEKYTRIESYIDDLQLWLQIAKHHEIGFVNDVLAFYRIHHNHLSSNLFKMQKAEYEIISQYSDEPIYPAALNSWNIRWFGSFAKCHKKYAIQTFLLKILKMRNFFTKEFYKGLIKLILPCIFFQRA